MGHLSEFDHSMCAEIFRRGPASSGVDLFCTQRWLTSRHVLVPCFLLIPRPRVEYRILGYPRDSFQPVTLACRKQSPLSVLLVLYSGLSHERGYRRISAPWKVPCG